MLKVASTFPFPGSTALVNGLRFRVQRHHDDGTALLTRDGSGSSCQRTELIADLLDPAEADRNAALSLERSTECDQRIALWLAGALRDRNEVPLRTIYDEAVAAAELGKVPEPRDNRHVAALLRQMGWAKHGWTGSGYDRCPLYVRVTEAKAEQSQDIAA